jgi:hypothetical protein
MIRAEIKQRGLEGKCIYMIQEADLKGRARNVSVRFNQFENKDNFEQMRGPASVDGRMQIPWDRH